MKFEDEIIGSKPNPLSCRLCGKVLDGEIYNWDFDTWGAVCIPACMGKFKDGVGA